MVATDLSQPEWQPTSSAQVSVEFLSEADDLLTRYLWDWTLFGEAVVGGRSTAKMNLSGIEAVPRAARRTDQDLDLCKQVAHQLRKGMCTVQSGIDRLAKVKAFEDFAERWEDGDMLFLHHLKRYVHALTPNSGVAFHETNRYAKPLKSASARQTPSPTPEPSSSRLGSQTNRKPINTTSGIEVGVFATRKFKKGEEINLCRGGVADLTEEEDNKLRQGGQKADFSVLYSSRKKSFGLLLGPARFVNHDCRNNVEFVFGQQDMRFRAVEDIQPNEELFTHYGLHYFEQNNAGCLCATCEQLSRGGFTPKLKPEPVPFKRETTPTRKSTRVPNELAPGTGHELTAQRSIRTTAVRSRSPSSDSDSSTSSRPERRRNERRAVATPDPFRTRPRLVQPKLPPPALYEDDYEYDARKKTIKYVGLVAAAKLKDRPATTPSPLPVQPRKRARDDEPPAEQPRSRRMSVLTVTQTAAKLDKRIKTVQTVVSSVEKRQPLVSPKQPKAVTPSRSSFAPPAEALANSSSSGEIEIVTLEDTDGSADEDQVALMLVARSRSSASIRDLAGFRAGSDSMPAEKESAFPALPPTPRSSSPTRPWGSRSESGRGPGDAGSPTPAQSNGGPGAGAGQNGSAAGNDGTGDEPDRPPVSLGLGLGSSGGLGAGGGAGGDGGDDGEDRKPFKPYVASPIDVDPEQVEQIEVDATPSGADGSSTSSGVASTSESGLLTPAISASGRDETDQEAARLLLAMGALFGSSSASTSSAKTTIPTSSSTASLDDSASAKSQLSTKAKGKRRATDGPTTLGLIDVAKAEASRTNRRRSHLDEPSSGRSSLSPAGSGRSSTNKGRVSQLGSAAGSRSASGSRSPRPTPPPPPEGARGTRRSAPIKGGVHDLLNTPEVANVAGTYDPQTGKYLSARRSASVGSGLGRAFSAEAPPLAGGSTAARASDSEVKSNVAADALTSKASLKRPKSRASSGSLNGPAGAAAAPPARKPLVATKSAPAASPAPARSSGRSTRSSFPMDGTALDQLLHAPGAVGGSGYDVATGKYLPLRHKSGLAGSPTAELAATSWAGVAYAANGTITPRAELSPAVAAATSAAILSSSTRSTRQSRPIGIPLQALMRDPAVASVTGAWDEAQKKYVMPKRAQGRRSVSASASPAVQASGGEGGSVGEGAGVPTGEAAVGGAA